MRSVVTDQGITSAIQAGISGPLVKVSHVKVGSSLVIPDSTMTDVPNIVWEGDSSYIQYQLVDERTFLFKVTLDESIGDFDIGCIGLFLEDGTMFTISTLIGIEKKIANNAPTVGNRKIFEIPIVLAGISGVLDVTLLVPDECSIPFVQTEASLPNYQVAPFSVYEIMYHTELKTACVALRTSTGWKYCVANSGEGGISYDEGMFDQETKPGMPVYFDSVSGTFKPADGTNPNKGYIGIRGTSNNIVSYGSYTDANLNLTPGFDYYAGPNGTITSTPTGYYIGKAITTKSLLVNVQNETVLHKVTGNINEENPSNIKYLTETAFVTYQNNFKNTYLANTLNDYAKKDMSNVGDVTFKGNVTFNNLIRGKSNRANWGDLAEFYYADNKYPEGTLVAFGGDKEITIASNTVNAVVTSKPGYLMNAEIENNENALPVALIGRVPVRVIGKVDKFDKIVLSDVNGVGIPLDCTVNKNKEVIARALEDNSNPNEKLVLCSILFRL